MDWSFQNAKAKVDVLNEYKIPIWVMEPLRGGAFASLSDDDAAKLKSLRQDETIPGWAFRYLQTIPNIALVLSGVSSFGQLRDNITTFETEKPLSAPELDTLYGIAEGMVKKVALPCTACGYCSSHCPQKLEIPNLLALYYLNSRKLYPYRSESLDYAAFAT
jgi:predicted aldo/keto reductase-like oxidoreductase